MQESVPQICVSWVEADWVELTNGIRREFYWSSLFIVRWRVLAVKILTVGTKKWSSEIGNKVQMSANRRIVEHWIRLFLNGNEGFQDGESYSSPFTSEVNSEALLNRGSTKKFRRLQKSKTILIHLLFDICTMFEASWVRR